MRFLVMGSLNYDYTYFVDHIVRPGETIASGRLERACGGKGFNQAAAAAAVAVSRKGASVSIPVWEEIAPFTSALPCAKVNPDV